MTRILHFQRKKMAEHAAREAAGESLWTEQFDQTVRTRILHAFTDAVGVPAAYSENTHYVLAQGMLLRAKGSLFLVNPKFDASKDLLNYLLNCDDHMVPSVIEAMSVVCNDPQIQHRTNNWDSPVFDRMTNDILREHRVSYELANSEMLEFSSRELHEEVVMPALRLIAGRPDWTSVESAYQSALGEISKGEPSDAITDAATALQEALTTLGCSGNSLGPLAKSAREKRLLAPHDSPMVSAVEKIVNWVSADRSEEGDAHEVSQATVDDAWLTVHIVGALILRLSKASPRMTLGAYHMAPAFCSSKLCIATKYLHISTSQAGILSTEGVA